MDLDLSPANDVMEADGVSLSLIELNGDKAHLALSVTDAECAECVLPKDMLELVVLDLLRQSRPTLEEVKIDDPREES